MVDPKMVELSVYNVLPHLRHKVVTDNRDAAAVLKWAVLEMQERYALLAENGARNIQDFNQKVRDSGDVGIWHETYLVRPGSYENIYNNMPPWGLGLAGRLVEAKGHRKAARERLEVDARFARGGEGWRLDWIDWSGRDASDPDTRLTWTRSGTGEAVEDHVLASRIDLGLAGALAAMGGIDARLRGALVEARPRGRLEDLEWRRRAGGPMTLAARVGGGKPVALACYFGSLDRIGADVRIAVLDACASGAFTRIKGGRAEIGAVNDALERAAMAGEVPEAAMRAMQVALDELLTNAIMHGSVSLNDPMQVDLIIHRNALRAVISHAGPAFDPTEVAAPDLEGSLQDRQIGGLGIHLVRSMMDEFTYEHADGRNVLKLGKNFR